MKSILVIISHPDDELIWAGNFLNYLQKKDWQVYVICLSGNESTSQRYNEFFQVCHKLKWKGIIVGKPIQRAHDSLGDWKELVEEGCSNLDLKKPVLILTHSPFGDEYNHPHHAWCYQNALKWARNKKYSLCFFSFIKLPVWHNNKLTNLRKSDTDILTEFSSCYPTLYYILNKFPLTSNYSNLFKCPKYLLQINFKHNVKKDIFSIYQSVGVEQHVNNYSSFHLGHENIYFFDKKGISLILDLFKESPNINLWSGYESLFIRFFRKIKKWLLK